MKDVWYLIVIGIKPYPQPYTITHDVGYQTAVGKTKMRADLLSFIGPKHIFTQNNQQKLQIIK